MKTSHIIGLVVLALLYLVLVWIILTRAGGITLYNLFLVVASGIIIFVPLYKKYIRKKD